MKAGCPPCNHNCSQSDTCPARVAIVAPARATVRRYTCDQLGVCQAIQPHCAGCFDDRGPMDCDGMAHPDGAGFLDTYTYWGVLLLASVASVAVLAGGIGYLVARFAS